MFDAGSPGVVLVFIIAMAALTPVALVIFVVVRAVRGKEVMKPIEREADDSKEKAANTREDAAD